MNTLFLQNTEISRIITAKTPGKPIPPDAGFRLDRHPGTELLIVLQGTCDYPVGDRLHTLTPGTAVLFPPWCRHAYGYREGEADLLHLWVTLPHGSAFCCVVKDGKWVSLPDGRSTLPPMVCALLKRRWELWEERGSSEGDVLFCLRSVLDLLLEELCLSEDSGKKQEKRDIVEEVLSEIRRSNGRDCSLEALSEQTGYSRYYLSRLVREKTGRTIGDFIDEARLQYVRSALHHGLQQKEIAWNLGFSSPAAFWNWKKKKNPC